MPFVACCQMCGRSVEGERPGRFSISKNVPAPSVEGWTICNACANELVAAAKKAARYAPMEWRLAAGRG